MYKDQIKVRPDIHAHLTYSYTELNVKGAL